MEFGRARSVIKKNPVFNGRKEYLEVTEYTNVLTRVPSYSYRGIVSSDYYGNNSIYGVESNSSHRMENAGHKTGSGSSSPTSSQGGRMKRKKLCEVCGDIAKSLHFGGLSCDSCKAFFRRSVHKDAYLQFTCGYDHICLINKQSRKACQKCRFVKCMSIGMEMKWVMSEEERKQLNSQRSANKKSSKPATACSSAQASPPSDAGSSGTEAGFQPENFEQQEETVYSPNVEEMLNYMNIQEQKDIQNICEFYRHSYERIPYEVPKTSQGLRNSLEVIGMFTTILRRFAYFSKLVPEFQGLNREDQGSLLKASVLEMVMLRGALSFDIENHRWPNTNLEFLANCPQLKVEDMQNLVSHDLFEMHMKFIKRLQTLKVDEPTSMLLIMIVMFSPERSDLEDVGQISFAQEKYCALLKKYVDWRYGPPGAMLYPKLLTQLSDLRELNDKHTEYNLNLAETETKKIRQDLSQLKLDPYPQWKIVAPIDHQNSPQFPQESSQFSPPQQQPPPSSSSIPPGPIRSGGHYRAHSSRMREAFLRRIPDLIDDPFGPMMSMEEMMGSFPMIPPPQTAPANSNFDPWQHRHHTSQQGVAPRQVELKNATQTPPLFDLEKLQNIQSIMESLNPETLSRLQTMFFHNKETVQTQGSTMPGITPGLFANIFTAEMQLQSQVNLANLMASSNDLQNPAQSSQQSPH